MENGKDISENENHLNELGGAEFLFDGLVWQFEL